MVIKILHIHHTHLFQYLFLRWLLESMLVEEIFNRVFCCAGRCVANQSENTYQDSSEDTNMIFGKLYLRSYPIIVVASFNSNSALRNFELITFIKRAHLVLIGLTLSKDMGLSGGFLCYALQKHNMRRWKFSVNINLMGVSNGTHNLWYPSVMFIKFNLIFLIILIGIYSLMYLAV